MVQQLSVENDFQAQLISKLQMQVDLLKEELAIISKQLSPKKSNDSPVGTRLSHRFRQTIADTPPQNSVRQSRIQVIDDEIHSLKSSFQVQIKSIASSEVLQQATSPQLTRKNNPKVEHTTKSLSPQSKSSPRSTTMLHTEHRAITKQLAQARHEAI